MKVQENNLKTDRALAPPQITKGFGLRSFPPGLPNGPVGLRQLRFLAPGWGLGPTYLARRFWKQKAKRPTSRFVSICRSADPLQMLRVPRSTPVCSVLQPGPFPRSRTGTFFSWSTANWQTPFCGRLPAASYVADETASLGVSSDRPSTNKTAYSSENRADCEIADIHGRASATRLLRGASAAPTCRGNGPGTGGGWTKWAWVPGPTTLTRNPADQLAQIAEAASANWCCPHGKQRDPPA